jgi:hypothetical protein
MSPIEMKDGMSTTMRFTTLPLLLMIASAAVCAAEQQGTLSKEATAAGPAVDTSKAAESPPPAAEPSTTSERVGGPRAVVRNDRLDLDTTTVTGNRELPKVMYVVPWKKSDLGDLPAQPFNTLLDEALTPVDRDVFRREVTYYGAINSAGGGGADAAAPPPPSTEK